MGYSLEKFTQDRFDHYSRRLAVWGVRQGIVLKSIEESLRRNLIDHLDQTQERNTYIASIIGKNEKTVRNLKNKFAKEKTILGRNRAYHVAHIVHEATVDDESRWLAFDSIFDRYMDRCTSDEDVDEKAIREVLHALVRDGSLIEQKQRYTSFYRTSNSVAERHKMLEARSNEERYEVAQSISASFDLMVDCVADDPAEFENVFFTEFAWEALDSRTQSEINGKIRQYVRGLVKEYEAEATASPDKGKRRLRLAWGFAPVSAVVDGGTA
jgi:hypothetical protein